MEVISVGVVWLSTQSISRHPKNGATLRPPRLSLLVLFLGVALCAVVMVLIMGHSTPPVLYDGIEPEVQVLDDQEIEFGIRTP
jgi:hypothetical protein